MAPEHHRDFKEGISLHQVRASRQVKGKHARGERLKNRIARRRRAPVVPVELSSTPHQSFGQQQNNHEDVIPQDMPSPHEINEALWAFQENPSTFDLQVLLTHMQAANILASGSEEDRINLNADGFLFLMGTVGPLLSARNDCTMVICYALETLWKLSTETTRQTFTNEALMLWLLRMLHHTDLKVKEHASTVIGSLAHDNTILAHKLLLTPVFVMGLIAILGKPADEDRVYIPSLAMAAISTIHVVLVASNASWTDSVSSATQQLAAAAMEHLEQLWTFHNACAEHKDLIQQFLGVLDAAFKHGHETTKVLADSMTDFTVLASILNKRYYCFDHLGASMLLPTVSCFANITSLEDPVYVDKVLASGFLNYCTTFLATPKPKQRSKLPQYRKLERETFLCMANIAAGPAHQVHALLHDADESICFDLVEHATFNPRRHVSSFETALWVIVNSMTQGTDKDLLLLVEAGALHTLFDYIEKGTQRGRSYSDKQLAKVVLQALQCALAVFGHLDGPGVERFHDKDLLEKLEWILEYPDEDDVLHPSALRVQVLLEQLSQHQPERTEPIVKRLF